MKTVIIKRYKVLKIRNLALHSLQCKDNFPAKNTICCRPLVKMLKSVEKFYFASAN